MAKLRSAPFAPLLLACLLAAPSAAVGQEVTIPKPASKAEVEALKQKLMPETAEVKPGPAPAPAKAAPAGCAASADLASLFSPECLETLRALRAPVGQAMPPAPSGASGRGVPCSVAVFAGTPKTGSAFIPQSGTVSTFNSENLQRCIEVATRLGFGIPGVTNIAAVDPVHGLVAVSCVRDAPSGERIACRPQPAPAAQGERRR